MGGSGCGKSTVLKSMIGLLRPRAGKIFVEGEDYWGGDRVRRTEIGRASASCFKARPSGVALTVGENVALPMQMFTKLSTADIGANGAAQTQPWLAWNMRFAVASPNSAAACGNGAGLARALALDPDVLFFDEPSAGLDPITSSRLDESDPSICGTVSAPPSSW